MSDDESNNSEINSESEDSDDENEPVLNQKYLLKPSSNVNFNDDLDGSEPDDDAVDDEEDDEELQIGGANDVEDEDDEEDENDDDNESDSDLEINEEGEPVEKKLSTKNAKKTQKTKKIKKTQVILEDDEDDDDDDEFDEKYLQKFDNDIIKNYINEFHPECLTHNSEEISKLSIVIKNNEGIIVDPLHKSLPFLTKYEKARILGQRAKQIETGSKPFVKVSENIVESSIIAELELRENKIPFIIRRPIPGGGCEYWHLKDLEVIAF
jgi:DNA-directed RNA polymerase subunit K/omega